MLCLPSRAPWQGKPDCWSWQHGLQTPTQWQGKLVGPRLCCSWDRDPSGSSPWGVPAASWWHRGTPEHGAARGCASRALVFVWVCRAARPADVRPHGSAVPAPRLLPSAPPPCPVPWQHWDAPTRSSFPGSREMETGPLGSSQVVVCHGVPWWHRTGGCPGTSPPAPSCSRCCCCVEGDSRCHPVQDAGSARRGDRGRPAPLAPTGTRLVPSPAASSKLTAKRCR